MYDQLGALSFTKYAVFRSVLNDMLQHSLYLTVAIWGDRCSHKTSQLSHCLVFFLIPPLLSGHKHNQKNNMLELFCVSWCINLAALIMECTYTFSCVQLPK